MGGPGGGARAADPGRLPRTRALRHVPVLPPGDAHRHAGGIPVLSFRRDRHRPAGHCQARHLYRRDLSRHAAAEPVHQEQDRAPPALDQTRVSGCARPDADLRRVRNVDRGCFPQGLRRDRKPVDTARRGAHLDDSGTVIPAGSPPSLREPGQAHQYRRGEIGVHGAAAGGALWHADGADAARDGAGEPRHAHGRGGKESSEPAAQAHRADDPVLPAGALRRHSRTGRHPRAGNQVSE